MSESSIHDYLNAIGRIPMLTYEEQIILGRAVQAWMADKESDNPCPRIKRRGKRAMDRMISANLRLVVSIARQFMHPTHGLSQMDLIQAGNVGLIRGVEKFDPERGYRCSTYFYWWIRQGITREIDKVGRTIRIPTTHSGTIAKAGKVAAALAANLGRTPSRAELATELGIAQAELEHLLLIGAGCHSLDASLPGDRDGSPSTLGDLTAVAELEPDPEADELRERMAALGPIEQRLITGRWGLDGPPRTLAQLASQEAISVGEARKMLANAMCELRKERSSETGLAAVLPATPGPIPRASVHTVQLTLL